MEAYIFSMVEESEGADPDREGEECSGFLVANWGREVEGCTCSGCIGIGEGLVCRCCGFLSIEDKKERDECLSNFLSPCESDNIFLSYLILPNQT